MNDWEQHANLSLQSLGEAYLHGHIDRGEFRARRRRILQGIRERHAQTQPNALHVASQAASQAAAYPSPSVGAASSALSHAAQAAAPRPRRGGLAAVVACAIIAAGLIAWWWLRRGG